MENKQSNQYGDEMYHKGGKKTEERRILKRCETEAKKYSEMQIVEFQKSHNKREVTS